MTKLRYQADIIAPREKVWQLMTEDATYRLWTAPFGHGSHFIGGWNAGDKILFLGDSGQEGMVSRIAESNFPEYLAIEHLGIVKDGKEDTTSEDAKKWAPSVESYRFEEIAGGTRLTVEMDSWEGMKEFFDTAWPMALDVLKSLAEA